MAFMMENIPLPLFQLKSGFVTVRDHLIIDIELVEHETGKGQSAEIIPKKVIEQQSLKVDHVSGATYSSKVILKAIQDALLKAVE